MKNQEIYQYALALNEAFTNKDLTLPAKANFCLQKNSRVLLELAQEIEKAREDVIKTYGIVREDGSYTIPSDKIEICSKELDDLFNIEQEFPILKFNIDNLGNTELSLEQMDAIMFMIED